MTDDIISDAAVDAFMAELHRPILGTPRRSVRRALRAALPQLLRDLATKEHGGLGPAFLRNLAEEIERLP